ncbi:MAG: NACHT domain-containing protein, partial [Okeania sp. SIO2F4]|uniref:NACHT domain-containing protein n=1 Tax=Okeania sp. SIO2F4 TaxID=2607790 RepID=UPI00142C21F8
MAESWEKFLEYMADSYSLDELEREVFIEMFGEKGKIRSIVKLASNLNLGESAVKTRLGKVYDKFQIDSQKKGKGKLLQEFLNKQYISYSQSKTEKSNNQNLNVFIDWQKICDEMLKQQKKQWLTTRSLTGVENKQVLDIYIPLGLVERQKLERPNPNISAEKGSEFYQEKVTPIENEVFFEQGKNLGLVERQKLERPNPNISAEKGSEFYQEKVTPIENEVFFEQEKNLGLVERQKLERPNPNISAEKGSEFYQGKVTPIENEVFFEQVIQQGKSHKSQGRRIAIIGEPGAGKTTLLQKVAFEILNSGGLPIWIDLADWQNSKTLEEYLLENWLKAALPIIKQISPTAVSSIRKIPEELQDNFVEKFEDSKVWLLLDGVDEMAGKFGNPLTILAQEIKQGWVSQGRIILSCRLNIWDVEKNAIVNDFDVYRNLDFSYPEEVKEFILEKWFAESSNLGQKLWEELEKSSARIKDLIKNPLRLTLLCRTWEIRQGKLPDTKAGIYQRLVETHYLWKDDNQDFVLPPKEQKELNQALGELAKKAIDGVDSQFRLRESFIKDFLGEPKQEKSLFWWALKLGCLNKVGLAMADEKDPDEQVYAFLHPTFQEYFAALAVPHWDFFLNHNNENPNPFLQHNGKDCVYRIFEPQWQEVILLWLGREDISSETKEEFIKALIEFKGKDKVHYFYQQRARFLAAVCMTEFDSCLSDEIIKHIIYLSLKNFPFDPITHDARVILEQTNREKVIKHLIKLLKNKSYTCHYEIIRILGNIGHGDRDTIQELLSISSGENEEIPYQGIAVQSLVKISDGDIKESLLNYLTEALNSSTNNWNDFEKIIYSILFIHETFPEHPTYQCAIEVLTEIANSNSSYKYNAAQILEEVGINLNIHPPVEEDKFALTLAELNLE